MAVYADVLVIINYAVNLVVLLACAKILGRAKKRWRLRAAALFGALGALVIFLPFYGFWSQMIWKCLLSVGMAGIAFGFRPYRRFLKALFIIFCAGWVFAGFLLMCAFFWMPEKVLFYNGAIYFDVSIVSLLLGITGAYAAVLLLERLLGGRTPEKAFYGVTVYENGKTVAFKALADTGNSLKEPFSGAPVMVCDPKTISGIRPADAHRFRLIPCVTVSGEGVLDGFCPERLVLDRDGKTMEIQDVYIAAGKYPIEGEYQAVFHPQMLSLGVWDKREGRTAYGFAKK